MAVLPSHCRRYLDERGLPFEELEEGRHKALVLEQFGLPTGRFDAPSADILILLPAGYPTILPTCSTPCRGSGWRPPAVTRSGPTNPSISADAGGSAGRATTANGAPASMASGPCSNASRRHWSVPHEPHRSDHLRVGPRRSALTRRAQRRHRSRRLCTLRAIPHRVRPLGASRATPPHHPRRPSHPR